MPVPNLNSLFDVGTDILSSSIASNGTILLQTGTVIGEEVKSDGAEIWFPSGYLARPAKSTPGKDAPQGISIVARDQDIIFATRDIRANSLQEALGYGEVQIFAGGPTNTGICKLVFNNDGESAQKVTITANTTKIEINSDGTVTVTADTVNVNAGAVNLGNGASLGVALAAPLKTWAAGVVTACANSPGGPITITPLDSSVESGSVKASS